MQKTTDFCPASALPHPTPAQKIGEPSTPPHPLLILDDQNGDGEPHSRRQEGEQTTTGGICKHLKGRPLNLGLMGTSSRTNGRVPHLISWVGFLLPIPHPHPTTEWKEFC